MVIEMTRYKTTKGTHVYEADQSGGPIRTLYIERHAAAELGERITVTVDRNLNAATPAFAAMPEAEHVDA